jgi:hypothetical protein
MDDDALLDRITVDPKIFGGKPIIRGRRLAVEHVLGMLAAGDSAMRPTSGGRIGGCRGPLPVRFDFLLRPFARMVLGFRHSSDRQGPHPMPRFLYDDHGAGGEIQLDTWQDALQATDHVCGPTVLEPHKHDLAGCVLERCCDLAEVEIRGHYNSVFRQSLREDLAVRHPVQPFVAQMNGIVALATQPIRDTVSTLMSTRMRTSVYAFSTRSCANHAAYSMACWMSSRCRSG